MCVPLSVSSLLASGQGVNRHIPTLFMTTGLTWSLCKVQTGNQPGHWTLAANCCKHFIGVNYFSTLIWGLAQHKQEKPLWWITKQNDDTPTHVCCVPFFRPQRKSIKLYFPQLGEKVWLEPESQRACWKSEVSVHSKASSNYWLFALTSNCQSKMHFQCFNQAKVPLYPSFSRYSLFSVLGL